VIVTLGAGDRRSHPNGHGRVDPINNGCIAKFFVACSTFVVGHRVAMERAADEIVFVAVVQKVARDLLKREPIEMLVCVQ